MLFFLICASVFSVQGLGEEKVIFKEPFLGELDTARIEFSIRPEFNILNENKDLRGIFWTNPFFFGLRVPLYRSLIFSIGNIERFAQSFDIYSVKEPLTTYVKARGGIEEIYFQFNQRIKSFEALLRGSYLFGSSYEVWNYIIDDYSIADTFNYRYKGWIFCAGLKIFFFSFVYEGMGSVNMERNAGDTTYRLPQVFNIGVEHSFKDWKLGIIFEHSSWKGGNNTNRLKGI